MSKNLIAFIFAAGAAALCYNYMGKRIGYGNTRRVWTVTISVFVVAYLIIVSAAFLVF